MLEAPEGDIVFMAQSFLDYRRDAIFRTTGRLARSGKQVYLLGDIRILDGKTPLEATIEASRHANPDAVLDRYLVAEPFGVDVAYARRAQKSGATYLSLQDLFSAGGSYRFADEQQRFLSYDGNHLTLHGSEMLAAHLVRALPELN